MLNVKCQCNKIGVLKKELIELYDKETELPFVKHKQNKCLCKNEIKLYLRHERKIYLCSCCNLPTDILIESKT